MFYQLYQLWILGPRDYVKHRRTVAKIRRNNTEFARKLQRAIGRAP